MNSVRISCARPKAATVEVFEGLINPSGTGRGAIYFVFDARNFSSDLTFAILGS